MTMTSRSRGSIASSGPSTETSTARSSSSSADTGGNLGSWVAASAAQRITSPASPRSHRSVPRQPRSSPPRLSVTNTPEASGTTTEKAGAADPVTVATTDRRARSTSACFCASVSIGEGSQRSRKIPDDTVVVAGDFARVGVFQHPTVLRAQAARRFHHRDRGATATRDVPPTLLLGIVLEQVEQTIWIECSNVLLHTSVKRRRRLRIEVVRQIRARHEQRATPGERSDECIGERVDRFARLRPDEHRYDWQMRMQPSQKRQLHL